MDNDRYNLLDNQLDALDRLFDGESEVIDLYAVTFATGLALSGDSLFAYFRAAAKELDAIVRMGLSKLDAREKALDVTNALRVAVAEAAA